MFSVPEPADLSNISLPNQVEEERTTSSQLDAEPIMKDDWTRDQLEELIENIMGLKELTPIIYKQIAQYHVTYQMSFKDIARCLVWYDEIDNSVPKERKWLPQFGISVVPNVREKALKYFEDLAKQKQDQNLNAKEVAKASENNIIFKIEKLPQKKRRIRQFSFDDIQLREDE